MRLGRQGPTSIGLGKGRKLVRGATKVTLTEHLLGPVKIRLFADCKFRATRGRRHIRRRTTGANRPPYRHPKSASRPSALTSPPSISVTAEIPDRRSGWCHRSPPGSAATRALRSWRSAAPAPPRSRPSAARHRPASRPVLCRARCRPAPSFSALNSAVQSRRFRHEYRPASAPGPAQSRQRPAPASPPQASAHASSSGPRAHRQHRHGAAVAANSSPRSNTPRSGVPCRSRRCASGWPQRPGEIRKFCTAEARRAPSARLYSRVPCSSAWPSMMMRIVAVGVQPLRLPGQGAARLVRQACSDPPQRTPGRPASAGNTRSRSDHSARQGPWCRSRHARAIRHHRAARTVTVGVVTGRKAKDSDQQQRLRQYGSFSSSFLILARFGLRDNRFAPPWESAARSSAVRLRQQRRPCRVGCRHLRSGPGFRFRPEISTEYSDDCPACARRFRG